MDCLIIGCGLTGSVIARQIAERGKNVVIWERREHVGGNMYDHVDEHGFLVQDYGPHIFHTNKKHLYDYICRFEQWNDFQVRCGAVWDDQYSPTPFNFTTIDTFYPAEHAEMLKEKLRLAFAGRETVPVVEVLKHPDPDIQAYAEYLFQNDYAPYTAKQWGMSPEQVDVSVLKRVPLRFSYADRNWDDTYQCLPEHSFTRFFDNLLDHPNITINLGIDALEHLTVKDNTLLLDGEQITIPVIYTGALDHLFQGVYGWLPYRSLRFEWKFTEQDSIQPAPVVAYPQAEGYTRITEYKKLPVQQRAGSSYAVEYPLQCQGRTTLEPYYPVQTKESERQFAKYCALAAKIPNLFPCGRLGDFKYYYMDEALERALEVVWKNLKDI